MRSSTIAATAQWFLEHCYELCGPDVCMFSLVMQSLVALNILSLPYICFAGACMAAPTRRIRTVFRITAPALALALLWQYLLFTRFPRNLSACGTEDSMAVNRAVNDAVSGAACALQLLSDGDDVETRVVVWLGLAPTRTDLVLLVLSFCSTVMQLHSCAWAAACAPPLTLPLSEPDSHHTETQTTAHTELQTPAASPAPERADSSAAELTTRSSGMTEPLLPSSGSEDAPHLLFQQIRAMRGTSAQGALAICLHADGTSAVVRARDAASPLQLVWTPGQSGWAPITQAAQPTWSWQDWLRFVVFRYSLDTFMLVVLAICCIERDSIHAAYLALTLYFFRQREALRLRGNGLFFWLPLTNWAVILVSLLFQTPFEAFALPDFGGGGGSACTVAHVIGLHRYYPAGAISVLSFAPHGAAAQLAMWAAMQVRPPCPVLQRVARR